MRFSYQLHNIIF